MSTNGPGGRLRPGVPSPCHSAEQPRSISPKGRLDREPVLPGVTAKWNGRATVDYWLGNPWTKGSYSFWKVGQYTRFAGVEREPEATATSPASTPQSTSRATSTAPSRPASEPPKSSCRPRC